MIDHPSTVCDTQTHTNTHKHTQTRQALRCAILHPIGLFFHLCVDVRGPCDCERVHAVFEFE